MLFLILNSQVGGILDELPNLIKENAALLSRTEENSSSARYGKEKPVIKLPCSFRNGADCNVGITLGT